MAGKTAIDTDLRDNLLSFIKLLCTSSDLPTSLAANELYWQLKPQRVRTRKVTEPAEHLQPST